MTAALPTIAADLVVGASVLQWMANVYVLVPAAPMLVCGTPGDRYGRRQLLLIGLGLFAAQPTRTGPKSPSAHYSRPRKRRGDVRG
ncbi:hypothetical protein AO501_00985 [Mycobacterium gordonae]|jgi:MFS family permease|uniref:Major facilitator superfamily (MFS) profile domain-containing protein n=2 Tax=Mycobacteriaceae TaxID=1762 RepID=A0A0Q2LK30_MYCGO|nr:hypothetical protein AO501_00985 [Mycobacterium gordonae]MBI2701939.1 MFS transporter [Mycobacterium sp.]MCV7005872.1 MFS transporter [Mycobacterium gordonae]OBS01234.1 hypothetical protein A9W98_21110 [Mycobacterium gordonae]ODR21410.1 hypothetical protein BHQ23_12550 [Mycobacterium gordonae]